MMRVSNTEELIATLNFGEQQIEITASFAIDSEVTITYPLTIQGASENLFTISQGNDTSSLFKVVGEGELNIINLMLEGSKGTINEIETSKTQKTDIHQGVCSEESNDIRTFSEINKDVADTDNISELELVTLQEQNGQFFKLIFLSNAIGATDIKDMPESMLVCGMSTTIPAVIPKRQGYTFIGWNMQPDGSGTSFSSGQALPEFKRDIALYAQWRTVKTLQRTISFTANSASKAAASVPPMITVQFGQRAVLPNAAPVLHGCRFIGWNTKADGKGKMYIPGQRMDMVTEDITLYAQWLSLFPEI